jgi:hypothetical protein
MVFQAIPSKFACATFKTFKIFPFLCQCLLAHEELVWLFFILFVKWTFTPGLVAYTSAYPITCKKSWQRGAQSQLITTLTN